MQYNLTGLTASHTYYYRAYVQEWDSANNTNVTKYGDVLSFTTPAASQMVPSGWLELPATTTGSDYYTGSFSANGARNYSYLYQYSTYTSLWTAYPLYSATIGSGTRSGWESNPNIQESMQVDCWTASYNVVYGQTNYVNNASTYSDYYARGHNIPNGDRNGNSTMQAQTYYATNSTPQIQNNFNSKIWSNLEGDVRTIAQATDTVYVVTGAAFRKVGGSESITYIHPKGDPGKNVPVPNYYWKVLLKVKWAGIGSSRYVESAKAVGVWVPHTQYESNNYSSFVTSVSQIETWTGFDFFTNLPESLKAAAKANNNWSTFQNF